MGSVKPGRFGDAVYILRAYVSALQGRIQTQILYPVNRRNLGKAGPKDLLEKSRERYFQLLEKQPATTLSTDQVEEMESIVKKADACILAR